MKEELIELLEILKSVLEILGYKKITVNTEKRNVEFQCFGCESFKERDKKVVKALLGNHFSEFYYTGHNSQQIFYRP